MSLLRFLCPFNQIVDLLASEHLTKKRIILVLLPQGVVLLSESVRAVDQILVFTIQLPVLLLDTDIVILYLEIPDKQVADKGFQTLYQRFYDLCFITLSSFGPRC